MQNPNISGQNEQIGLLSIGEAAEFLGVSIDTLRRWEKKGKVVAFRSPGGHRYFEKEKLKNLFNQKYTRVPTPKVEKPPSMDIGISVPEATPAGNPTQPTPVLEEVSQTNSAASLTAEANPVTPADKEIPETQPPVTIEEPETQPPPKQDTQEQEVERQKRREQLLSEILKDTPKKKRDSLQIAAIVGLVVFTVVDLVLLYLWFSTPKIISPLVP